MSPTLDPGRVARSDGEASRERLLRAGLRLFAHQGYAKTSTRELAEAAGVNIASISYYFGDKAGLYRAAFLEPTGETADDIARLLDPALDLPAALRVFYAGFLEPLRQGDEARWCMKLHMREMLEPSGLWDGGLAQSIRPQHDALVTVLARHLGGSAKDDDLHRLAVCLSALAVHLHVGRDIIDDLRPSLNRGADAIDRWVDTLVGYGLSMIDGHERRRTSRPFSPPKAARRHTPTAGERSE